MTIHAHEITAFEQRYRTAFVNSLAGFRQAVLVGTRGQAGNTNLAIFNSLIHLGANPALLGMISRPDTVTRDTLQHIRDTQSYTLNYVASSMMEKTHQTSARYAPEVSEFDAVGFTPMYSENQHAPYVAEAAVSIGMRLEDIMPIPINGTILIIGSVQEVHLDESLVGEDGYVDLAKADVLVSQGLDAYFKVSSLGRLAYAKV